MNKNGVALISVLGAMAIALIVISASVLVSIINAKMGLTRLQRQKAYQGTEALAEEAVIRFVRERNFTNPYPDWTENCLQIEDFTCKMDLDLTSQGGVIDVWGKEANKVRHLQLEVLVNEDESVSVSARKEIY